MKYKSKYCVKLNLKRVPLFISIFSKWINEKKKKWIPIGNKVVIKVSLLEKTKHDWNTERDFGQSFLVYTPDLRDKTRYLDEQTDLRSWRDRTNDLKIFFRTLVYNKQDIATRKSLTKSIKSKNCKGIFKNLVRQSKMFLVDESQINSNVIRMFNWTPLDSGTFMTQ